MLRTSESAQGAESGAAAAAASSPLWSIAALVLLAALLRIALYTGYFGSDEVTYINSAFKLLHGDWSVSTYAGANRYGVNLPIAAFAWLFGQNEAAAALYSLICSIAEVGLVAYAGVRMLGVRAGLLAGLMLATLPLHVHFAGRIMADAPLALMITASFVCFAWGERHNDSRAYFLAGLAAGASFWIKTGTIFYVGAFLLYPIVVRRLNLRWLWMVGGLVVMMLANNVLMWLLTDRFWFLFETTASSMSAGSDYMDKLGGGDIATAAGYYLQYLFVKAYHTWLLGPLALAGLSFVVLNWRQTAEPMRSAQGFVAYWAVSLVVLFSLLVVSTDPIVLVPKQTNYMLVFAAPLSLLAGLAMARLPQRLAVGAAVVVAVPSIALAALSQASISVFVANSKAAVAFARAHPGATIYTSTNPYRAFAFHNLVHRNPLPATARTFEDLGGSQKGVAQSGGPSFAIVDTQTWAWGASSSSGPKSLAEIPACWVRVATLEPEVSGIGARLARVLDRGLTSVGLNGPARSMRRLHQPAPAYVYRVPLGTCE